MTILVLQIAQWFILLMEGEWSEHHLDFIHMNLRDHVWLQGEAITALESPSFS